MKNTLISTALLACMGLLSQAYAEVPAPPQSPSTPAAPIQPNPAPTMAAPTTNSVAGEINCEYKIAPDAKVEQATVLAWSQKALTQAFTFQAGALDAQMQKLQPCFTDQGWTGFNTALQKSGNLEAIKSQKLTVSSQIEGQPLITEAKDNQWKLTLPLTVTYQNDKEKVSQLLSVDLTVGRKMTGDLGITQMIASPRGTVVNHTGSEPTTAPPPTPANPAPTPSVTHP